MRVILFFICFVGLVIADNEGLYQAVSFCSDVCGACGAKGNAVEDVCVCKVDRNDRNDECLEEGKRRMQEFNLGWRVEEVSRQRRFTDLKDQLVLKHLRRPHRSVQDDVGFYGPPIFGQAGLRNYRSGVPAQSALYEIVIGNENEDTVQLVFPQSENLEVQHQYLFEDDRGKNHPCSHVISDMDLDFGMIQDNSWETHPTGFERPRNKFHDYSAEERNYPLYGTNQDNLSTTRVDIQDDWLEPSSPGNTRSSFESGRTQFDLLPNGFNSRETSNENYVYEKNNFDYENSFEDNGDSLKMY